MLHPQLGLRRFAHARRAEEQHAVTVFLNQRSVQGASHRASLYLPHRRHRWQRTWEWQVSSIFSLFRDRKVVGRCKPSSRCSLWRMSTHTCRYALPFSRSSARRWSRNPVCRDYKNHLGDSQSIVIRPRLMSNCQHSDGWQAWLHEEGKKYVAGFLQRASLIL